MTVSIVDRIVLFACNRRFRTERLTKFKAAR